VNLAELLPQAGARVAAAAGRPRTVPAKAGGGGGGGAAAAAAAQPVAANGLQEIETQINRARDPKKLEEVQNVLAAQAAAARAALQQLSSESDDDDDAGSEHATSESE
jgi:hypothetical protein